ncbi:hypothetical protein K493DRAFT_337365 [Basidiobolus meristosporus CBS 931.73]|uniref:Cyanocobalamin reductase (cyanide-eliminating) n=1 Tax=Basidiobolus meristosporus CBS 931.73 TaxID=1314790 RepID=A0A1Y1YBP0_9FUNG|nr:hypothetical protein K493DRAFT_337365 [Basidiobolus meristosporus CBS 931.73]|eukprot:ORX95440.1 hypothetical protein K493DRAFT_337365 [Basidiobolus meristosporus CBS 931.73]
MEHIVSSLSNSLLKYGLDIVLPFSVAKYNALAIEHNFQPLPLPSKNNSLAILIGNTKYLWPHFLHHLSEKPESFWEKEKNPLDSYVVTSVENAVRQSLPGKPTETRFSHVFSGENFIAIQHAGQLAGLQYDRSLGFCLHPTYGPWIGLRAVVIVGDAEGYEWDSISTNQESLIPLETLSKLKQEMDHLRAQYKQDHEWSWGKYWRQWIALRDKVSEACLAQQWRYCDEQIRYHYLKDRIFLKQVVQNQSSC